MKHWDEFEAQVRAIVKEPQTGEVTQADLVIWANEALKELPSEVQLSKARIVVSIGSGVVALVEEDWPGTEFVGTPAYQAGRDGTFYIRYAEKVDAIRELRDMGTYDDCGVYTPDWCYVDLPLQKVRQEYLTGQVEGSAAPWGYGVYRYMVYEEREPPDPPRPLTRPYEVWAVWLEPPFDPAATGDCASEVFFFGVGLNDVSKAGTFTGVVQTRYVIIIDGVAPDTFTWWDSVTGAWTPGVAITGVAQALNAGVTVTFANLLGHTLADTWAWDCMPMEKYFEVQYRRRPPEIDLTELCLEYTQPYFYVPEICENVILNYVCMQALFAVKDGRWSTMVRKYEKALSKAKHNLADRGDVDHGWGIDPVDVVPRVTGIN